MPCREMNSNTHTNSIELTIRKMLSSAKNKKAASFGLFVVCPKQVKEYIGV